jgi:hypothetical protein
MNRARGPLMGQLRWQEHRKLRREMIKINASSPDYEHGQVSPSTWKMM